MGEELGSLSLKDLQNLEQQLDSALKNIRSRKVRLCYYLRFFWQCNFMFELNFMVNTGCSHMQNQVMYESISELQKKVSLSIDDFFPKEQLMFFFLFPLKRGVQVWLEGCSAQTFPI